MARYYPSRNDIDKPDKLERVVRDIYDRLYRGRPASTVVTSDTGGGTVGPSGPPGPPGPRGPAGPTGAKGDTGDTGPQGEKGDTGDGGATIVWVGDQISANGVLGPSLTGPAGPEGPTGPAGATGATGPQGIQGIQGIQGDPGEGVPTGGTTGQVLTKTSDTDYDTEWADATGSSLPAGGTTGQVLAKASDADDDVAWVDQSGGSGGGLPSLAELVGTYVYFSDFDMKALNSAPEIAALYSSGGTVEYPTPPIGRVGVVALQKKVTSSQVVLGSPHPAPYILGGGEVVWETCVMIDQDVSEQSLDNAFVARAGLGDTPSGALSNGVLFELYKSASTLPGWKLRCTSGGSSSYTPSDNNYVPASNEWVHLKLVVNAAGTAVEGFINNSSIGILDTFIPITGLGNYFQIWTIGGATNSLVTNLNIDWLHVRITPTRAIP